MVFTCCVPTHLKVLEQNLLNFSWKRHFAKVYLWHIVSSWSAHHVSQVSLRGWTLIEDAPDWWIPPPEDSETFKSKLCLWNPSHWQGRGRRQPSVTTRHPQEPTVTGLGTTLCPGHAVLQVPRAAFSEQRGSSPSLLSVSWFITPPHDRLVKGCHCSKIQSFMKR